MKRLITRLVYGLLFALPVMLLTYAWAQAANQPTVAQKSPSQTVCPVCHQDFAKSWEQGAHSKAANDPLFKAEWEKQNKPAECLTCHETGFNQATGAWLEDGVTCAACHDTKTANHPLQPMIADRSSKACGTCHNETYFEWQSSKHRQNGIDCVSCHDPHNTSLKADSPSAQCATCHKDRSANFSHTQHSQQGLTCVDCHMVKLENSAIQGHARLDHSFMVRLDTCNKCHSYQMHDPAQIHVVDPTPQAPDAMASVEKLSVASTPGPSNPMGFALLAGLFGLAAGVIVAPGLQRLNKNGHKDE